MGKKSNFEIASSSFSIFNYHKNGYGEGYLDGTHMIYYYDKTIAFQRKKYKELRAKEYVMISKTVSGTGKNLRYAVIWKSQKDPEQVSDTATGLAKYNKRILHWFSKGYLASSISASGDTPKTAVYSGTFQKITPSIITSIRLDLTNKTAKEDPKNAITAAMTKARADGLIPVSISQYGTEENPLYACIWKTNTHNVMWNYGINEPQEVYERRLTGHKTHKGRPALIALGSGDTVSSVFTNDSIGAHHSWVVFSKERLAQKIDEGRKEGYLPIAIDASVVGKSRCYSILLSKHPEPLERKFTKKGSSHSVFNAWDNALQKLMESRNVKAASLAVVYKGRLVHAQGYTFNVKGQKITQPTSQFRTASVTKVITSMAVHRLIQEGVIKKDEPFSKYVPTENTNNELYDFIQIGHVLSHTGSFSRNHAYTHDIAKVLKIDIPVTVHDRRAWCRRQELLSDKLIGLGVQYSNLGYTLLGQLIEEASGMDYYSYVTEKILKPLGLTRPVIGSAWGNAKGEVHYEPKNLKLTQSAFIKDRDLVSSAYEGANYSLAMSSGGFVFSAVDMAKLLGAFHSNVNNPVLHSGMEKEMLTPAVASSGVYSQTYGWPTRTWKKNANDTIQFYAKSGAYTTTAARIDYRDDDVSFVVLTNKSGGLGNVPTALHRAADKMKDTDWPAHDLFPQYDIPSF